MKKFFSAFLLMAVMVLSVGTFVACNDLTDEMTDVKTQTTQNAATIDALSAKITALEREKEQEFPKYEEMCRRFLADAKDFSEEKLKEAGIEKRFLNVTLKKTIDEVEEYIKNLM